MGLTIRRFAASAAAAALLLAGCSSPVEKEVADKLGKLEGRSYANAFFKLRFAVPEGWSALDDARREDLMKRSAEAAFGKNVDMKDAVVFTLFVVAMKPFDSVPAGEANPNISMVAENVWGRADPITSAASYLDSVKASFGIEWDSPPAERRIGGRVFLGVTGGFPGQPTRFTNFVAIDGKYALTLQLAYVADAERDALLKALDGISFSD